MVNTSEPLGSSFIRGNFNFPLLIHCESKQVIVSWYLRILHCLILGRSEDIHPLSNDLSTLINFDDNYRICAEPVRESSSSRRSDLRALREI